MFSSIFSVSSALVIWGIVFVSRHQHDDDERDGTDHEIGTDWAMGRASPRGGQPGEFTHRGFR